MAALSAQELRQMQAFLAEHKISIKAIFAIDSANCLGYKDQLIYRNPDDLKFFKSKTYGHAVIMGRKTFDSLRNKPLPERLNIVVTHNPEKEHQKFKLTKNRGARRLVFVSNYTEIPHILYQRNMRCGWVIGGKQVLTDLFNLVTTFVVTQYACSALNDWEELGLFQFDTEEDREQFKTIDIIRVPELMRRMRALPKMKLMPSMTWGSPSGKLVRYNVTSYTRPNPQIAAKLADLRAEELIEYNRLESEKAEDDIKNHLRKNRF